MLNTEDIHIVNCHLAPTKNEKVQNNPYDMGLTEFKDIFKCYFDVEKTKHEHFTKDINRLKPANKKLSKDKSCYKKYYENLSLENWRTKGKTNKKVSCKECLLKYAAKLISFSSKSKSQASVLIESAEKNINKFCFKRL